MILTAKIESQPIKTIHIDFDCPEFKTIELIKIKINGVVLEITLQEFFKRLKEK